MTEKLLTGMDLSSHNISLQRNKSIDGQFTCWNEAYIVKRIWLHYIFREIEPYDKYEGLIFQNE